MAKRRAFGSLFKRNGAWYVRLRFDGREIKRRAGLDRRSAELLLAELVRAVHRERATGVREVAKVTVAELWSRLEPVFRARLAPESFRGAARMAGIAAGYFCSRAVADLTTADLVDLLAHVRVRPRVTRPRVKPRPAGEEAKPQPARHRTAATANRWRSFLSAFWREAVARGFARENVASEVKRAREELLPERYVGAEDVARLAAAATPRMRPLVVVLAETGLRRGEALALEWRDVDLWRASVLVRRSKSKRSRQVPLTSRAHAALEGLRAGRAAPEIGRPDLVFAEFASLSPAYRNLAVHRGIKAAAKRAGLPGIRLHDLRHSFAARLLQAGAALSTVSRLLGHSSLVVTARYARHVPESAERSAVALLDAATNAPRTPLGGEPASPSLRVAQA